MSDRARRHVAEMRKAAYVAGIAQSALAAARVHAVTWTPESARRADELAAHLFAAIYGADQVPRAYVDEDLLRMLDGRSEKDWKALHVGEFEVERPDALQSVAKHTTTSPSGEL